MDAETSIDLVGMTCVSLLSDSLKLYFNSLKQYDFRFDFDEDGSKAFKNGFVSAYKCALGEILATDWVESDINFEIIEQVVLTRNQGQHGNDITRFRIRVDAKTIQRFVRPFFVQPEEAEAVVNSELAISDWLRPNIKISQESLVAAITEIEKLSDWVEENRDRARPWFEAQRAKRQT